jgi:hypothetical protein
MLKESLNNLSKDLLDRGKEIANLQKNKCYSEEDMLMASKYGYNYHKSTQFPEQEFEDSCIRNTQQWLITLKNKI